jgi:hypothetical protein
VTQAGYPIGGIVCGNVTSFSPIAVVPVAAPPMEITGFYAPVDMNGVVNTVKGGSTVPLQFEVLQGDVELTDVAIIASFRVTNTNCETGAGALPVEFTSSGGTSLSYSGGHFRQNWKTPKPAGCYKLEITTTDSESAVAYFRLK